MSLSKRKKIIAGLIALSIIFSGNPAAAQTYVSLTSSALNAPGSSCSVNGATSDNGSGFVICSGGVWVVQPVTIGAQAASCSAALTGEIQWTGAAMQVCDGSAWQVVTH